MGVFNQGNRIFMTDQDLIVSKTDLGGRIRYANETFLRISGYALEDIINKPHAIIRHPGMPRSVFRLLWQTIEHKKEIFLSLNHKQL